MMGPVGTSDWYMMGPGYQRLVYDGSWVSATGIRWVLGTSDWYMMGPGYQRLVYDGS